MDKYIVPICDASDVANCWIEVILARSITDCEDKLMSYLLEKFSFLKETITFEDFIAEADKHNIIIGKITDLEEI